jgi:hypothetical protein
VSGLSSGREHAKRRLLKIFSNACASDPLAKKLPWLCRLLESKVLAASKISYSTY